MIDFYVYQTARGDQQMMGILTAHLCILLLMGIGAVGVVHHHQPPSPTSPKTADQSSPTLLRQPASSESRFCYKNKCRCSQHAANCSHNFGRLTFIPPLPRRIRYIFFSFNNLTRISDKTFFGNVTDIVFIDLSYNGLTYIHPDAFRTLWKLKTVKLDNNRLTYSAMVPVLSSPSLWSLSVRNMHLGLIPDGFFSRKPMPPLQLLKLSGNVIQHLNLSAFSPLANLTILSMANSRVIITTSAYIPQLRHLDLRSNALFDLPTSCDNHTFSLLPNLQELNFAENKFSTFETEICLPELKSLDLSKNPIQVMQTNMFNGHRFPKLINLELQGIQTIGRIEKFAFQNPGLKWLSLMYCNIPFSDDIIHPDSFRGLPSLIYLQISHNLGSYLPDKKFEQLFGSLESLQEFNLGNSGIQEINENLFRNLSSLTILKLYRNKLTEIPDRMFRFLKKLIVLDMADNELRSVRESMFNVETRRRLKHLDLSGNLFVCDCDLLWFKEWLVSSPIFRKSYRDYKCSNIPNMPLHAFTMNPQACIWSQETYSAIIATVFVFLVLLSFASAMYHFRWHIRLMLAFRGHSDIMKRRLQTGYFHYDIFVSFAGEDLPWVRQHLVPALEGNLGLRLCIHERDFQPGKNILNNIVDSVKASKKYLMLFSRHFAKSPWCQFELDLCLGHVMDHDDALIVTCLDDIASRDMTSTMAAVLKTTTYIQWRNEVSDVRSFWHRIGLSVKDLQPETA